MALVGTGSGSWVARGVYAHNWTGIAATGPTSGLDAAMLPDKTVVVQGTWGTGGSTVVIEGSNSVTGALVTGGTWWTLNDPQGNALSFTTGKIEAILENPRIIRARCTAKSATTSLAVRIIAQSHKR